VRFSIGAVFAVKLLFQLAATLTGVSRQVPLFAEVFCNIGTEEKKGESMTQSLRQASVRQQTVTMVRIGLTGEKIQKSRYESNIEAWAENTNSKSHSTHVIIM